jgi:hypothetical protein
MNFISYQPLKEQLRNRTFTDRQALPYFILSSVLSVPVPTSGTANSLDWVLTGCWVLITALGLLYAYRKNGGSDGVDFIKKFIVLGWIALVRWTLVFIPLFVILVIAVIAIADTDARFGGPLDESVKVEALEWFQLFAPSIFMIVLFQRIGRHIKDTAMEDRTEGMSPAQQRT